MSGARLEMAPDDLDAVQMLSGASDRSLCRDALARASWSSLIEPGDSAAHRLVDVVGAVGALEIVAGIRTIGSALDEAEHLSSSESAALGRLWGEGLVRWRSRWDTPLLSRRLAIAQRIGARLLLPESEAWPPGLRSLGDHEPIALWLLGEPSCLAGLSGSVAVVGARAATGYGEHVAAELASGLAERGVAIVSGAAYGIDGVAHRSALAVHGMTVAFLAGGLDRLYPSGHVALLRSIAREGAVVSELPAGSSPTRWRFLQRNRLIAASTDATIVVEAGARSGSLNTAGHAAAIGRPLGAVPGPVTSGSSAGCHRLLREFDAQCVTSVADAIELLGFDLTGGSEHGARRSVPDAAGSSREESPAVREHDRERGASGSTSSRHRSHPPWQEHARVLDVVPVRGSRRAEEIARLAALDLPTTTAALGVLALRGSVERREDGGWRLLGSSFGPR